MKEMYNKFFRLPENGKISDKVFMARITVAICVIVLMVAAMSFTAYAYFSTNISSANNIIKTSHYGLTVTPPTDTDVTADTVWGADAYVLDNSNGSADKEYVFNLTDSADSTATVGYCKIDIKTDLNDPSEATDKQTFYTEPIWNSDFAADTTKVVTRNIKIVVGAGKTAQVKFTAEWGSCQIAPIVDDTVKPEFLNSNVLTFSATETKTEIVSNSNANAEVNITDNTTDKNENDTVQASPSDEPEQDEIKEESAGSEEQQEDAAFEAENTTDSANEDKSEEPQNPDETGNADGAGDTEEVDN